MLPHSQGGRDGGKRRDGGKGDAAKSVRMMERENRVAFYHTLGMLILLKTNFFFKRTQKKTGDTEDDV